MGELRGKAPLSKYKLRVLRDKRVCGDSTMPEQVLPRFPENVPIAPLLIVDYALIRERDADELEKLWKAATQLGFWYLTNHDMEEMVDRMFDLGVETMDLPLQEKMKFEQGDNGRSCGYKAIGMTMTDHAGSKDNVEFLNISKDDVLSWPTPTHATYPSTVCNRMESTVKPFVNRSLEINNTLMCALEAKLALPSGTFAAMHKKGENSGCEARITHSPPVGPSGRGQQHQGSFLMAHTDFGSLSILYNRQGGLQVLMPGAEEWHYVKPLPGHAICNLGDAMNIFSGGILRANLHRVVTPPGSQSMSDRWSIVFLSRPADRVMLRALTGDSDLIREAAEKSERPLDMESTAQEWFMRRIKGARLANRKGPESWKAGRGMEHKI